MKEAGPWSVALTVKGFTVRRATVRCHWLRGIAKIEPSGKTTSSRPSSFSCRAGPVYAEMGAPLRAEALARQLSA